MSRKSRRAKGKGGSDRLVVYRRDAGQLLETVAVPAKQASPAQIWNDDDRTGKGLSAYGGL
jgi:hypothetical protein